ncbi:MAG: hypothetical protein HKN37_09960 [Rhodothermales bacterium]|nr:hypothetical protein [Rhodothermales bacterium]
MAERSRHPPYGPDGILVRLTGPASLSSKAPGRHCYAVVEESTAGRP